MTADGDITFHLGAPDHEILTKAGIRATLWVEALEATYGRFRQRGATGFVTALTENTP